MQARSIIALLSLPLIVSCNQQQGGGSHGPIRLGDSSLIIVERDSNFLRDMVSDYKPQEVQQALAQDTAQQNPIADSTDKPAKAGQGDGIQAELGGIQLSIPSVAGKRLGRTGDTRASFQLSTGRIDGAQLQVTGGVVTKVEQRYQTTVVWHTSEGDLKLDPLSTSSELHQLKGSNGTYFISGLNDRELKGGKPSATKIREAAKKALKRSGWSNVLQKKLAPSLSKLNSIDQKPLDVKLRSVTWTVEGKDAKGKGFRKELRVELPQ